MASIYCFSATGNSLYVAKQIGDAIEGEVLPMRGNNIVSTDEIIGFVFPTFFWGLPYQVQLFISNLEIKSNKPYIFAITTYGGAVWGVLGAIEKLLQKKGYSLNYGKKLKAVENYIPNYRVNDTEQMEQKVNNQLRNIIRDIKGKRKIKVGPYTFINQIINKFFPAHKKDCDRYFTVSNACNKCGTCEKVCPVNNIDVSKTEIVFKHHCEHCMACSHACPQIAIEWKKGTIGKQRFRNRHISLKELTTFNDTTIG